MALKTSWLKTLKTKSPRVRPLNLYFFRIFSLMLMHLYHVRVHLAFLRAAVTRLVVVTMRNQMCSPPDMYQV